MACYYQNRSCGEQLATSLVVELGGRELVLKHKLELVKCMQCPVIRLLVITMN